uniref:Uncharacterized protein n=1 Tax=Knipowitschia caucasica TaxID=637954 RepID=A0AAV2JBC6_KNICA
MSKLLLPLQPNKGKLANTLTEQQWCPSCCLTNESQWVFRVPVYGPFGVGPRSATSLGTSLETAGPLCLAPTPASVGVSVPPKGAPQFSCSCHGLDLFLMTSKHHSHSRLTAFLPG